MTRPSLPAGLLGLLLAAWPLASPAAPRFEAQVIDPDILTGYGLAIGDVDGDGDADVLLADKRDFVWYENPEWTKNHFWSEAVGESRLKKKDNVCIAARDINGDGKVEVAVGANWNPGETVSEEKSGSIWFLGSLGRIMPVRLPHEPTTHRMHWITASGGKPELVVLPLHGRGNRNGAGENGVRVLSYRPPEDLTSSAWKTTLLSDDLHKTHNFDVFHRGKGGLDQVLIGGAEGTRLLVQDGQKWINATPVLPGMKEGVGEIRWGSPARNRLVPMIATIEPMHGDKVVTYTIPPGKQKWQREVLDESLNQGHALAVADVLGTGRLQVIAGWRSPDKDQKVGIRLYSADDQGQWATYLIDDNTMACEDLKVADLNGDGKLDIVACGRASKNVVIYWNKG
ncbi:MAG: hypothetical protein HKN82_19475 [Akkermansiaceae bacterium]|nr:hypothetical protein [Akkermansiaceae bacterium]NNM29068.1 hypothetical protein [Akkermansiaceae bacterium]